MQINYLIISYKFNCFTETLMRSLPADIGLDIIHVGKPCGAVRRMNRFKARIEHEWTIEADVKHGAVVDAVFNDSEYAPIRDCDYIFFIDHDCFFDNFSALRNHFASIADARKADIVAFKDWYFDIDAETVDPQRERASCFRTVPCFMARPKRWPMSWAPLFGEYFGFSNAAFDTGQAVAWDMIWRGERDRIAFVDDNDDKYLHRHMSSAWSWLLEEHFNDRRYDKYLHKCAHLFSSGYFLPTLGDMETFAAYPFLARALSMSGFVKQFAAL